jgi:hypothetical protein
MPMSYQSLELYFIGVMKNTKSQQKAISEQRKKQKNKNLLPCYRFCYLENTVIFDNGNTLKAI